MGDTGEKKAGMRGWLKVVFGLSLALNLLVLGAIGGAVLRHGGFEGRHHMSRGDMAGGPLTRALTKDERRAVAREMRRAFREAGHAGRASYRETMQGLLVELRAQPFDPAPVAARMEAMRGMIGQRMDVGQTVLLEYLTEMEPEARQAFAARLEEALARRYKSRK
ncbi:periplasmic heavy metal sensor [Roseovarius sp. MMSF_3281]|uniref:periplasmic heavy metal sensor n=1 Tax=Roseovarius sp. MMSF_3281 TaxID=3046694 RepID=UPI00273CFA7D|nr:periplasmic heavy metal sensor [Roseovarius sp. MMSF_3281]